jgi:hypothetical protein
MFLNQKGDNLLTPASFIRFENKDEKINVPAVNNVDRERAAN